MICSLGLFRPNPLSKGWSPRVRWSVMPKNWIIAAVERATVRPPKWMKYEVTYRSKITGSEKKNWYFDCVHCMFGGRSDILTQTRHQYFQMVMMIIRYNLSIKVVSTEEHFIFDCDGDYRLYQASKDAPKSKKGTRAFRKPKGACR